MRADLRQAAALVIAGAVIGFGANFLRGAPLPFRGRLDPPPPPEPGADLPALSSAEALARWEEGALVLDIRPREEFVSRHVAGAVSFEITDYKSRYFETVGNFGADVPLLLYGAGADSHEVRRVAAHLINLGQEDVGFAVCGLDSLLAAGMEAGSGEEDLFP
jgi:rhodanese-related sulfurtransferase